ncbi:MAG: hypothetical protein GX998_04425 [Firmicutes bacterium]|nr:hypothetical protein [Bacillota bacterium]
MASQIPAHDTYYQDEIELREIVEVIRKRIWLVILIPLIAALTALGVSKFIIVPEYAASTGIALGSFVHEIYGNVAASKEVLMSRDLLRQVYQDLDLHNEYSSVDDFAQTISVEDIRNTRILNIRYQDSDPERAQKVVQTIADRFLELSDEVYTAKRALLEERLLDLQEAHHEVGVTYQNTLETLKALEAAETQNAETALARARIIDYLVKGETSLVALGSEIHEVQVQLSDLEKTTIIEQPMVGIDPVNARPLLNTAIALVLGGMVALGVVFILEYFEKNPLQSS